MATGEKSISPEERLLKVIKGDSAPASPKVNPFTASRGGAVLPSLSSVMEFIISSAPVLPPDPTMPPQSSVSPVLAESAVVGELPQVVKSRKKAVRIAIPVQAVSRKTGTVARERSVVREPEPAAVAAESRPIVPAVKVEEVSKPGPADKVEAGIAASRPAVVESRVIVPTAVPLPVSAGLQQPARAEPKPATVSRPVIAEPKIPVQAQKPAVQPPSSLVKQPAEPVAKKVEQKPEPKAEVKSVLKEVPKDSQKSVIVPEQAKAMPAAPVEEKPKLKVAKADVPAGVDAGKPVEAKTKEKPAPVAEPVGVGIPLLPAVAKKQAEKKFVIRNVNFGLAAAALLLIVLSVTEIFAKIRTDDLLRKSTGGPAEGLSGQGLPETVAAYRLPPLDAIIKDIGDRPVLCQPGQRVKESVSESVDKGLQMMDWMKYAQENLKLMGFSGSPAEGTQAAIVQEGKEKDGKISFFKVGQRIQMQGIDILVENINDDQMFLTDGKRRMTVR